MKPELIAVDFDGTIATYEPRTAPDPAFIRGIEPLVDSGMKWVINTDRPFNQLLEFVAELPRELLPAALLCQQRDIYLKVGDGYESYMEWNFAVEKTHDLAWKEIMPFFPSWVRQIEENYDIRESFADERVFAFMVDEEEIESLRESLAELISPWPELKISGNQEWGFVVHSSFSKGRLLQAYANYSNIPHEAIIAVGDGLNDVPMLSGEVTPMVGCPANSCHEAKNVVREANGFIAERDAAAGTLSVIRHWMQQES